MNNDVSQLFIVYTAYDYIMIVAVALTKEKQLKCQHISNYVVTVSDHCKILNLELLQLAFCCSIL